MENKKLDQILLYDHLGKGSDPTYDLTDHLDIYYLGLAGELASEIKCNKITLPMLSREDYDWELLLQNSIIEAASHIPQKHVNTLSEAFVDFSKKMELLGFYEDNQAPNVWLANKELHGSLRSCVTYDDHGHYTDSNHYTVDRKGLGIEIRKMFPKTVIITPQPELFGCLSINEQFFNFFFFPKFLGVYHLKDTKINHDA